jgi:hypothetical protein
MSKLSGACYVVLGLVVSWYAPSVGAVKVVRDPSISAAPQPPKALAAKPDTEEPAPSLPKLTAAQVAERNAVARGGLTAWRAVKTLSMSGQLDAGGKKDTLLPYKLQIKRPHKQRLAIEFQGQTALQVFDGEKGWKVRPFLGRTDPEPFSAEELRKTEEQEDLEGPLIDYAAKGSKIALAGTATVDGRATYKLTLTAKDGHVQHLWIDGTTFLEAKIEGHPRRLDGRMHDVETYLSDYHSVEGLLIPYVSETRVEGVRESRKMTVENVAVNLPLDDALFAKPLSHAAQPGAPAARAIPAVSNAAQPRATAAAKTATQ